MVVGNIFEPQEQKRKLAGRMLRFFDTLFGAGRSIECSRIGILRPINPSLVVIDVLLDLLIYFSKGLLQLWHLKWLFWLNTFAPQGQNRRAALRVLRHLSPWGVMN